MWLQLLKKLARPGSRITPIDQNCSKQVVMIVRGRPPVMSVTGMMWKECVTPGRLLTDKDNWTTYRSSGRPCTSVHSIRPTGTGRTHVIHRCLPSPSYYRRRSAQSCRTTSRFSVKICIKIKQSSILMISVVRENYACFHPYSTSDYLQLLLACNIQF